MQNSGVAMQVVGVFTMIAGFVTGLLVGQIGGAIVVGVSVISGILFICLGNAFFALGDIERNSRRAADAMEKLTNQRATPPEPIHRIKQLH